MKKLLIGIVALSSLSGFAGTNATIESYISHCTQKRVFLDLVTKEHVTKVNASTVESKYYISNDQMDMTEIYKTLKSSIDGEEVDVTDENGFSKIEYTQLSGTEEKIETVDNWEESKFNQEGNLTGMEKVSSTTEAVWRTLEKTANKKVTLRISNLRDGKEDKEQILRTKTMINENEFTIDMMTLNPQDVTKFNRQLLFSFKSCLFKKTE